LTVPITHDETATVVHYFNFSTWEIMMYPDSWPNNHILNTLITKYFIVIFGNDQWVVRLPNLLSFVLYSLAIFRINKSVLKINSIFFLPAALLFVANPYLLDFFGLCRGYGISCAIAALSVSYLISGYSCRLEKHVWISLTLSILASYANFSLLVFWCATSLLVWIYFYSNFSKRFSKIIKPTILIIIITLLYAALIANPIFKMQSTNQFQYWNSGGFYRQTILSVIDTWRYGSGFITASITHLIAIFILIIITINCLIIINRSLRSSQRIIVLREPVFVTTMVLLLSAFVSMLQTWLLKTPSLFGRTSLFFYPLFIIALTSSLGLLSSTGVKRIQRIVAIVISLFCLFHLAVCLNLNSVREWWFDANTLDVLKYLKDENKNKDVTLKTNWFFHPSFHFYDYTGKTPWLELSPYDKSIDVNTDAEYYYIFSEDYEELKTKFKIIKKFSNDRWLVRKDSS
jgi:hypothetical protein